MLNQSGASDRQSFVEQLENAFKTPARIDLRYTLPKHTVEIPPVPTLPVNVQDLSAAATGLSTTVDDFSTELHDTLHSEDEEYCRRLSLPMDSPSVDIVRERPGNPLASSRNSKPSDGQLNRSFRFGGSPMPSQRSDKSYSDETSEMPLTLSDIIPPHSQQLPNNSGSSLVEEDSSVLKSIMARANTVLPVASEVAVPRVRPWVGSNIYAEGHIEELSRDSATSQVSDKPQSRTSFAGLDSFDEVRRGFEFGPNRPVFYPPVSFSSKHNKHDSMFSVASVSSFGSVIDNGAPDPFGYARHSRPPSEDMSISMSMTVDDTFSFMYQKRRSRVDSDASSFYFRSQPSMMGPLRRGHRAHDSIISTSAAPPVSLYNRSHHGHGHRRGDSSGSVSSVALSYALHGANGGRATWAKHSRNDPSIDSVISDYSMVRLSRPGLGDKMLDSEFDHGVPLSAISASPNQSFDSGLYDQYQHQERTGFDSIMDTRRSVTCDSLMDDGSKIFSTSSVFFEHSRIIFEEYSVQSHFRPVSIISVDSSHHAPREDDTMISVSNQLLCLGRGLIPPNRCLTVDGFAAFLWVPSCNSPHVRESRRGVVRRNVPPGQKRPVSPSQSLLRNLRLPRRKLPPQPSRSSSLSHLLRPLLQPSSVARG
jgi:serine/arginine repetitive matrix protein 2